MRRRADQHHAWRGMAELGDQPRDFEARQLPTLTRLRALRDLDFNFAAIVQVFGGDAKAARGNLLDRGIGVIAIGARLGARGVFTAFAGIAARANAVHGDGKRFMRFGAERAKRNAWCQQALPDFRDAFHFFQRNRRAAFQPEIEQIAQRHGRQAPHRIGIALEGLIAFGLHRTLQGVDQCAVESMRFATAA